jgi:non-ribosomal peptide synthetase component F
METLAGTHDFDLSAELPDLHRFSRERAVSLFMTSFAALQALMHCLSGAQDLVVGADVAGRNRRETEPLIGFFINLLPLRTRLDGDPGFDELVTRVRDTTLAAYAHQDLPFDRLLDIVRPERIPGANPLFQVKLVFHNVPVGSLGLLGIDFEPLAIETGRTELDLVLHLHNQGADFPAVLEYRSDLFEPASVARFAALYRELLRLVLNRPGVTLSELKALLDDYDQRGREQARSARRKADLTRLAGRRGTRISGQSGPGA